MPNYSSSEVLFLPHVLASSFLLNVLASLCMIELFFFTVTVALKRISPFANVRVCIEKDAICPTPMRRT